MFLTCNVECDASHEMHLLCGSRHLAASVIASVCPRLAVVDRQVCHPAKGLGGVFPVRVCQEDVSLWSSPQEGVTVTLQNQGKMEYIFKSN